MAEQGSGSKAERARRSVEQEAQDARRLVFGARSRLRPPRVAPTVVDDRTAEAGEIGDILRRLAGDLEEETQRLRDEVANIRSESARAEAALREELQRASDAMVERAAEDVDREVGPTLAEAVSTLTEQLIELQTDASTLVGAVERLAPLGPAVDRLEQLASRSEPMTGALADALGELTQQLASVGAAVREQVDAAVTEALSADARQRDSATAQALGRMADEFVLLRQQVRIASKQGAPTPAPAQKAPAKKASTRKRPPRTDAGS
jgi:hypothetical protein